MKNYKIALVGTALSHPFTFADILFKSGIQTIYVWDQVNERAASFCSQFPQAHYCDAFEELISKRVDGAIICTESHLHDRYSIPFIEQGIPVFIDKVMAVGQKALSAIEKAYKENKTPVMSSSILRYSPLLEEMKKLKESKGKEAVLGACSTIFHSIEGYLREGNTWQDEKDKGGGTLLNMGVHGVELIYAILGRGVERVFAATNSRFLKGTQSEDMAVILLDYGDGLICTVNLVCGTSFHGYELDLFFDDGRQKVAIPSSQPDFPLVEYGYWATMDRFLQMVATKAEPMAFNETVEIMKVLHAARKSSDTGKWMEV